MNEMEFIFTKLKHAYYKGWTEDSLEECKQILTTLTHEQLFSIRNSKWMDIDNVLYPTLYSLLFKNELNQTITKLNELCNTELIAEIHHSKSAFKRDKAAEILNQRFDSMPEEEKKSVFQLLLKKTLRKKNENE